MYRNLLLFTAAALALPTQPSNEQTIRQYFADRQASLHVLATTTTSSNQTIDWIALDSQGEIATAPPASDAVTLPDGHVFATPELEVAGAQLGPAGTVPVLRKNIDGISLTEPLDQLLTKNKGGLAQRDGLERRAGGVHRYGSSSQHLTNYGTRGSINLWNPKTQTANDFSLLQTGVTNGQGKLQTAESGLQVYKGLYGDYSTHFFTFYTTNDYSKGGNNLGCYNTDCDGWVQVSKTKHPGMAFTDYSTYGGTQNVVSIQYRLYQGNWWMNLNNEYIGYYPAKLYARSGSTSKTLGDHGDNVGWWGEVYDDQTEAGGKTTTDMGSGKFPNAGLKEAAFVENIQIQTNTAGNLANYDGSAGLYISNPDMYSIKGFWNSGTSRGSYCLIGGPGEQ